MCDPTEKAKYLESVLEEAFRRFPNEPQKMLWYICESSNMPRVRSRFLCDQLAQKLK